MRSSGLLARPLPLLGAKLLFMLAGCLLAGCGGGEQAGSGTQTGGTQTGGTQTGGAPGEPTGDGSAAQICVDAINEHRASLKLPPYARWTDAEGCSSDEAKQDAASGEAHGAFGACGESAQNECPGWDGPAEQMIPSCLQMMWDEGPGDDFGAHGHFINMSSTTYTKVACGFFTLPDGKVWSAQNFK